MLVAGAVLPHPPLLVPDVAAGAAHELESVRSACAAALDRVQSANPNLVVVVGVSGEPATFEPGSMGSLAGFGVPVQAALPGAPPAPRATQPLPLTVGAWLLGQVDDWPPLRAEAVPQDVVAADAVAWGQRWGAATDRVAIIAMGDGSAALTMKAPGYLVEGAEVWQKRVTQALADVDLEVIGALDAEESSAYAVGGRPAWQVLAGAAGATAAGRGRWRGELLADESPYGVAYVVATWMWEQA